MFRNISERFIFQRLKPRIESLVSSVDISLGKLFEALGNTVRYRGLDITYG